MAEPSREEVLAEARRGIERHRKADLEVRVSDAGGRPCRGVPLSVRMVRHEFLFGCALFDALADREEEGRKPADETLLCRWEKFRQLAKDLFNFATLPFYWKTYEREKGRTASGFVSRLYDWCVSSGMTPKGHPLVWHEAVPAWLPQDETELLRLMRERLERIARDFGPRGGHPLAFVDFINEPTAAPRHFSNPVARWMQRVGPDEAITTAYDFCREFDLPSRGIINHYLHDDEFFCAVRRLIDSGRKVAAVGLQSHQHSGTRPPSMFWETSDRFASLGVAVHWTENSVLSGEHKKLRLVNEQLEAPSCWPSTPEGEERQAQELVDQYTTLFGHPAVAALTQWNFSDARSWLGAPSGLLDRNLNPKPAYEALYRLIKKEWWTDAQSKTNGEGLCRLRVFRGNYEITAGTGENSRSVQTEVRQPSVSVRIDL